MTLTVVETFQITGRGLVVVVDGATALPVGKALSVVLSVAGSPEVRATAFKEWLLYGGPPPHERECFLLKGLEKEDVPVGATLSFEVA